MSLDYYAGLLTYRSRIEGFRAGIDAAVEEGDRVLDLGTGLGTFAHFAVRAGAGRVWAVDADPVVHVARTVARASGLSDRVEFVRGRIPELTLPEPIDVLVFEDLPPRLLDDRTYRLLGRVAGEILAPGARIVPGAARLGLAPVRSSRVRSRLFPLDPSGGGTGAGDGDRYGVDWSPTREYLANQPRRLFLAPEELAAEPVRGGRLPLLPPPRAELLEVGGRWSLAEAGPIHALALWFELEVAEGRWMGNGPGADTQPWGQVVLPLDPPVPVPAGGGLVARVAPESFPDGAPGWLTWRASWEGDTATGHEFAAYPAALEDLYPGGGPPAPGDEGTRSPGPGDGAGEGAGDGDPGG